MPDILSIKAPDWELSVWSRSIEKRARTLLNTLSARGENIGESRIGLIGVIEVDAVTVNGILLSQESVSDKQILLSEPLFFENLLYEFEFIFKKIVSSVDNNSPHIRHQLSAINDVFHYVNRGGVTSLRGSVNFGNNIGWFRLPLRYWVSGQQRDIAVSFQVLPTKMDLANDLRQIYQSIDKDYPLWRFALAERTEQDTGSGKRRLDPFPLFWIALFKELQAELNRGVTLILHAPHSRLLPSTRSVTAERLKGKLPRRLSEKVKQDMGVGNFHKRYSVEQKKLSLDTPENRFIKMVLEVSRTKLSQFSNIAEDRDKELGATRLSDAFFDQIKDWQKPLSKQLKHPLFMDVGSFTDMSRESLVLQQKPGYSKVYKVWQQLKLYLDVLGNQTTISMKSVAELYEVWCFLEIRRILTEELGFKEAKIDRVKLKNKGHELTTVDGFKGAFEFTREDGITISLAHEPVFTKNSKLASSWLTSQKPDILLKATFASGDWLVWLFDAKYRIKEISELSNSEQLDQVPDDAINQMHRYRDALIHQHKETDIKSKSRPVFGAYALYPGYFDQVTLGAEENYYAKAISEIGIGAFPLLPSTEDCKGSLWLQGFLEDKLGQKKTSYSSLALADKHYVDESARIPYTGLEQTRYSDLTMTMSVGPKKGRTEKYSEGFEDGTAGWYHVPEKSVTKKYASSIMRELRYCAIATISPSSKVKSIKWVWAVKSAKLVERKAIKEVQAGVEKDSTKLFWLLELGKPVKLEIPVSGINPRQFNSAMKLTTLSELTAAERLSEVRDVYKEFFCANV